MEHSRSIGRRRESTQSCHTNPRDRTSTFSFLDFKSRLPSYVKSSTHFPFQVLHSPSRFNLSSTSTSICTRSPSEISPTHSRPRSHTLECPFSFAPAPYHVHSKCLPALCRKYIPTFETHPHPFRTQVTSHRHVPSRTRVPSLTHVSHPRNSEIGCCVKYRERSLPLLFEKR
jgi:hypothetical protein